MNLSSIRKKVGNFIAGEESGSSADQQQGAYSDKNHTPLPTDSYPYPGLKYDYHFTKIDVLTVGKATLGLTTGQTLVSSDITSKYGELSTPYGQGFVLADFNQVPGIGKIGWNANENPYQAVFSRPQGPPVHHSWQLLVVKSDVHTTERAGLLDQLSGRNQEVANTSSIVSAIAQQTAKGGRLICIESTGQVKTSGLTKSLFGGSDVYGCDVFFNVPSHPNPTRYTYQLINVPVQIMMFGPGKLVKVTCDWMKHFVGPLQQGWRLAEIFWDQGRKSHGDFTFGGDHNSIWFFEKEALRLNDPTPVYEGTIIEYKHTVKIGFFQTKAKGDWAPMITEMGKRGWELACMLETPEVTNVGLGNITYKLLFFFQRRIIRVQAPSHYSQPQGAYQAGYPQNYGQGAYGQGAHTQGAHTQGVHAQGVYAQPPTSGFSYAGAPQGYGPPPPYNADDTSRLEPSAPPLPDKR
ncbi:uncharacterized protein LOC116299477 [Actinia tenebrosa]|uniref:Uncharacterized protein LOC116299477 n=1 Tax=Actinia tenebrosa TaxID=6105 RepID=A0A6P8IE38_ACTTE|nr:uncharacterized protein LOC116299477 [Actinia tenebrosa]